MIFPRILSGEAAKAQDVFQQLLQFERLDRTHQLETIRRQLLELMQHAHRHSPFWKMRLDAAGFEPGNGLNCFPRLPVLTRADLQENLPAMRARGPDMAEHQIVTHASSGSTGQPVQVEKFRPIYAPLYMGAILLIHHQHGHKATKTLGVYSLKGSNADDLDWGPPLKWFGPTGRAYRCRLIERPVEELYDAVLRYRPHYIKANPTVIRALAQRAEECVGAPPPVEQFLSWAGPVTPELRRQVHSVFGAKIVDSYSCEEVGYIALQCTQHDHYHVLAATTVVEIVDDAGHPCPAGVFGRVLVTSLHSFAMPLLRYEVGDLAQWGPACDCGVQTPVIERILGRTRDLVRLPNGSQRFVAFSDEQFAAIAPIREYQVILYGNGVIEFVAQSRRALGADEKTQLVEYLQTRFDYPFRVVIREVDDMHWGGYWKRRDFVQTETPYNDAAAAPGRW